jgi:hypothetical protein
MIEKDNGKIAFGMRTQRFASGFWRSNENTRAFGYRLWSPYVKINVFPKRFKKDWTGQLKAEWFFIRGKIQKAPESFETQNYPVRFNNLPNQGEANAVRFTLDTRKKMVRSTLNIKSDLQSGEFLDWGLMWQNEATFDYIYRGKGKRHLTTRVYFGMTNGEIPLHAAGQNGLNDYLFDGQMLGRSEFEGLLSRQYINTQGGLFLPAGRSFASNDFLFSARTAWDIPISLPINIYAGVATSDNLYVGTAGIGLPLIRSIFEVYIPLIHVDENGWESLHEGVYLRDLISFQLNLDLANPFNLVKKLQ